MDTAVVGILGFLCIIFIVVTLFQSKTLPSIAFIVFPSILALCLVVGGYYTFPNIGSLVKAGFSSTGPTAALFVFSVLYFGIMNDTGMLDVIIGKLINDCVTMAIKAFTKDFEKLCGEGKTMKDA